MMYMRKLLAFNIMFLFHILTSDNVLSAVLADVPDLRGQIPKSRSAWSENWNMEF